MSVEEARKLLESLPPPAWLVEMVEYHRRTGCYRPTDLRRLLGDPCQAVTVAPLDTGTAARARLQ